VVALIEQLKDIIQDLYQIMVQVSTYDSMGKSSKEVLSQGMYAICPPPSAPATTQTKPTNPLPQTTEKPSPTPSNPSTQPPPPHQAPFRRCPRN
jgi:hypothetical protein